MRDNRRQATMAEVASSGMTPTPQEGDTSEVSEISRIQSSGPTAFAPTTSTSESAVHAAMVESLQKQPRTETATASETGTFSSASFVTPLKDLCVEVVAKNFQDRPTFGNLPEKYIQKVVALLDIDLPLEIVGQLITDEDYWKRRSRRRWRNLEIVEHGNSWKQLYFERNLADTLER